MTIEIHQTDAYAREFEAVVERVEDDSVALDRTAFYPGGGGQPADRGRLIWEGGSASVEEIARRDGVLLHRLDGAPPDIGTAVRGQLDWERRYALMRTHTALHILCGVVWRDHGAQVTGGNMRPLSGRLDFELESLTAELVGEIEDKLNAEVEADRPIRVQILPREQAEEIPDLIRTKVNLLPDWLTEIRTVEIVGLDLQADGGTHVASTSEVGRIEIARYKSKGRINKRIEIALERSEPAH